MCVLQGACIFPSTYERFRFDAQRVGDAVDVVEIGDHLRGVMDCAVVEAACAQSVEVGGRHSMRCERQLLGEVAQGAVRRGQLGAAPVAGDQVDKAIGGIVVGDAKIGDLGTEVVRVRAASIGATIGGRDHRR